MVQTCSTRPPRSALTPSCSDTTARSEWEQISACRADRVFRRTATTSPSCWRTFRSQLRAGRFGLDYWQGETIIMGIRGPVDIQSFSLKSVVADSPQHRGRRPRRRVQSQTLFQGHARVFHPELVISYSPGRAVCHRRLLRRRLSEGRRSQRIPLGQGNRPSRPEGEHDVRARASAASDRRIRTIRVPKELSDDPQFLCCRGSLSPRRGAASAQDLAATATPAASPRHRLLPPLAPAATKIETAILNNAQRLQDRAGRSARHLGVEEPRAEPHRAGASRRQSVAAARQRHSGRRPHADRAAAAADRSAGRVHSQRRKSRSSSAKCTA